MLIDGEIDLLSDVSYTPERSELMLYSSLPMGREEYFAFVSPQSESGVHSGDYASFNGKRIGVNKGTYQEAILRDWLVKRGVQAEIVELTETEDDSVRRLQRGEIDVYISLHAYSGSLDITPVCKIGSSDFFFAVSKNRPELLRELNSAMSGIQDENIYYIEYLQDKYLSYSGTNLFLTQSELKWLAEHGPIRVGYRDNYMPFCAQDKPAGALTGALNEFLALASGIMKNAEIEFAAVPFTTISDAAGALKKGEIDCIFPVNLTDYDGEELGVLLTLPLMQTEMDVAVRSATQRDFSLESDVIVADSGEDPNYETFLLDCFPNWKHERFENAEQAATFENHSTRRFIIRDTGIGIDREFLPKLFEAFSQEETGARNQYGSTGLGMAISKNIVQLMNGEIHVESEKGAGSAFTVTVTLKNVPQGAPPQETATQDGDIASAEPEEPGARLAGRRALIVEDMEINAETLGELLNMADIRYDWAENGRIALERFESSPEHSYDAVLMDIRMPIMDGLAATSAIRALKREDAQTVPIIAVSANAFEEDIQRSMQAGMNGRLSKPVEPERLYDTLERMIFSKRRNSDAVADC